LKRIIVDAKRGGMLLNMVYVLFDLDALFGIYYMIWICFVNILYNLDIGFMHVYNIMILTALFSL